MSVYRRGAEGVPSALPSSLWILGLLGSVAVGWSATRYPLVSIALFTLLISGFALVNLRSLWLILFTIGIHFDDLFVPLGFAKVGTGDFALGLLLGYWALWRYRIRRPIRLPDGWQLVLIYIVGVGISWQLGPSPHLITGLYIRQALYVVGYFVLVDLMTQARHVSIFVLTAFGVIIIHSVVALLIDDPNARVDGLVNQPNIFGGLIGPGAIIAFGLASERSFRWLVRVCLFGLGALILLVLILTVSRGAQLAFACATLWMYRSQWRIFVLLIGLGALGLQLLLILDPDQLSYIFERWSLEDDSVSTRKKIILNALRVITEYPFFGVGFSQFAMLEDVIDIDAGHGRASHNHYLGELSTIGIPSALALFSFVMLQGRSLWQISAAYRARKEVRRQSESPNESQSRYAKLSSPPREITLLILQGMMIFQSTTLVFRGGRRMIEWSLLALYTATVLIYRRAEYPASNVRPPESS